MDFNILKLKFEPEEKEHDWEILKTKFESDIPDNDWENLKVKFESGAGVGVSARAKARTLLPEQPTEIPDIVKPGVSQRMRGIGEEPKYEPTLPDPAITEGVEVFGGAIKRLPKQIKAAVLQATQKGGGAEGASAVNKDKSDQYIAEATKEQEQFVQDVLKKYGDKAFLPGIKLTDIANLPQSLAFSVTSMGAGLAAGGATALLPIPGSRIAAWGVGTYASGRAAYEMSAYQIMQTYLDLKNEEKIDSIGQSLTLEEENNLKKGFNKLAHDYAMWEALPEAISNLAFVSLLTAPLTKMVGKTIAGRIVNKIAALYGEEILTETVTEIGQKGIMGKAGLPGGGEVDWTSPTEWVEAFKAVAPQTFLLTTIMGSTGTLIINTPKVVKSLDNEVKPGPLKENLIKKIEDKESILTAVKEEAEVREEIPKVELTPKEKPKLPTFKPEEKAIPEPQVAPEEVKEIPPKAIPQLTKDERNMLENTLELDEGKIIPSGTIRGTVANQKAKAKLEEKGYIKEGYLTEKGIELSNVLKSRIETEQKGIPIVEREITKSITDSQFVKQVMNEELIIGKIGEEDYYTDARIMLKGKLEGVPISKAKPNFEKIFAELPKEETTIKPTTFSHLKDEEPLIWFDNKVPIKEKFYDFIIKKFPEAEFRSVEKIDPENPTPRTPIKIYQNDEFVGLIMPLKIERENIPINVLGKAQPKPPPAIPTELEGLAEGETQKLSARQWQVEMEKEAVIPEKINKTEIMTWADKAFGFPIKGKATHRWKAAGVFYPKKQIVRMEKWGELSVAAHEIAHGLDGKIQKGTEKRWKNPNRAITSELADLDYDQSENGRRTSEGFAEYMRHRLTVGDEKKLAPAFDKYFNEEILPQFPEMKKSLEIFKQKLDIWNKQGAENRIIQHIDWKGEHTKTRGLMPKIQKALEWINIRFNDELYYPQKITKEIEKVIGKEIRPSKNPAILMEYSKAKSGAIARTFVMDKAIDEHGNVVGDSLVDILKPIPNKEMKQFISYAVSKRALNLAGRKIESGFDIDDAKYIVNKYKDKGWDSTVNELTKWADHTLDWVVRAGGLDKEVAQLMRDLNPVYLPFKRAFIDEISVTRGVGGYVDTGKAVKSIKGSGRPIINPLESIITQTRELIAKAQKIRIAKAFIDLASEQGVGGFITRVPAPMKATTFSANQIKSYLDEIATGEEGMIGSGQYDDFLTVFTQDFKYSGKENIVSIWEDGKQEFYEIHPDLYEAFKGVDPLKLNALTKVFAPFSRMLRLGATGLKLSFGLARNPFRDALSYVVFSKRNNVTVFDPIKGYYKDITTKPGEATWRFKKLGGGLSGQIGLDRASVQNSYDEMLTEKLGKVGKILKVVKHPVNTLADLVSITEMGPRSTEIEAAYKKYTSEKWQKDHPDWTEEDAFIQAFNDAQDVTVNFTKSGKWAKQINQTTAFFNVAIRGPEKVYRSFRERPIQTFVKGLAWCTAIAVASWYKNKDKDWYKNLPPSYKYSNLFFEVGGNVYRLPIPFELGIVFMAAPQAALDMAVNKDDKALKGLMDLAKAQIPDPTPSMFGPAIDVATNKNYLGVPIESEGMQYLYPTERKRDYTTKLAVGLSKGMNNVGIHLSPIQLDYMLDSYSGGFLRQFRITGDELYNYPVIGDLMLRDPNYPKRQLNEFFSDWELLKQKKSSGIATREEIRKLAKIDGFYDYYKSSQERIKRAKEAKNEKLLNTYYKQLTDRLKRYGY